MRSGLRGGREHNESAFEPLCEWEEHCEELCKRLIIMNRGRIIEDGPLAKQEISSRKAKGRLSTAARPSAGR